ncbi:Lrp/AsnC family transcriptional regulator [Coralliovum pocilloporae]|uniref:Lrp/AsnC family transcriptional regulator n=1 Tax=Coralliovum pocilloporae TaxID=3066369 RepID=UPI003307A400
MTIFLQDETDRKLLALLRLNARESTASLGRKLGIARSTVQDRINRLIDRNVIEGFTIREAPRTDETVRAHVGLSVDQKQSGQVVAELKTYPEITVCHAVSGRYDLFLSVEAETLERLDDVLDRISATPGIERSHSWIVLASKFSRQNNG